MMRLCLCAIALLFLSNAQAQVSNTEAQQPEATQPPSASAAPTPAPTPLPQLPNPYSEDRPRHFAIGIFTSGTQTANFEDAYLSSTSGSGPLRMEFDLDPATGFILEYRNMPKNAWGVQAGLSYEFDQKIKKVTMKGAGGTVVLNVMDQKYRATAIYVNGVYRWNEFYVPLGLNISRPEVKPSGAATFSGGVGAQLGIGYQFTELFGLELVSNVNYLKIKETSGTSTLDYGYGYVSGLRLQAKFAL